MHFRVTTLHGKGWQQTRSIPERSSIDNVRRKLQEKYNSAPMGAIFGGALLFLIGLRSRFCY